MRNFIVIGLAAGFFAIAPASHALVIDFEAHGLDTGSPIIDSGFSFSFEAGGWGVLPNDFVGFPLTGNGTTRIIAAGDSTTTGGIASVTFKPTDDSAFSLQGFDAATGFNTFENGSITVEGTFEGGGTIFQSFDTINQFLTYSFNEAWANLDSVKISDVASGAFSTTPGIGLDNIQVNNPVPEPATIAVTVLGLAGVIRRRRARK